MVAEADEHVRVCVCERQTGRQTGRHKDTEAQRESSLCCQQTLDELLIAVHFPALASRTSGTNVYHSVQLSHLPYS